MQSSIDTAKKINARNASSHETAISRTWIISYRHCLYTAVFLHEELAPIAVGVEPASFVAGN